MKTWRELDRGGNPVSTYKRGADQMGAAWLKARITAKGPEVEAGGDTAREFLLAAGALAALLGTAYGVGRALDRR